MMFETNNGVFENQSTITKEDYNEKEGFKLIRRFGYEDFKNRLS